MTWDLRWILVVLANLLMILLVAEINHYLSFLSVHVFLGGLLLAFGVLRLRLRQGLLANGITALALDAMNPFPFGRIFLVMVTCHVFAFWLRGHFARENVRSATLVAAGMNAALFLVFAVSGFSGDFAGSYWSRVLVDGAFSTVVLFLAAPWFLSLQKTALAFLGIDLDAEQREAQ